MRQGRGGEDRVLEGLADQAKLLRPRDHPGPSPGLFIGALQPSVGNTFIGALQPSVGNKLAIWCLVCSELGGQSVEDCLQRECHVQGRGGEGERGRGGEDRVLEGRADQAKILRPRDQ